MKGYVEVYKIVDDKRVLIDSGPNMLLDGFSEVLTDIMTVSPILSGMSSASGILDCSNYVVNAVSYSKSPSAYSNNAHGNHPITVSGRSFDPPQIWVVNKNSTSSFYPIEDIPSYPQPEDRILQNLPSSVSSLIVTYGQNLNLLQLWSSVSAVSSIGASGAYALGTYAVSAAGTGRTIGALFTGASALIASSRFNTGADTLGFNGIPSMDWRGFQTKSRTNSNRGILASSVDVSADTTVIYQFEVSHKSMSITALYGGIYSVGLWCIDIPRTLQNGISPPFAFNASDPKIEYKLVARRVFNRNLCYVEDNGSTAGFTSFAIFNGTWIMNF